MSYILDALKKSEQERQRGGVPNLQSNHSITAADSDGGKWKGPVLAVVIALNVIVIVFWVGRYGVGGPNASVAVSQPEPNQVASASKPAINPLDARIDVQSSARREIAKHAEPVVSPVAVQAHFTAVAASKKELITATAGLYSQRQIAQQRDKSVFRSDENEMLEKNNVGDEGNHEELVRQDSFKDELVELKKYSTESMVESREEIMNLSQLPGHIRDQIPALDFSSHMYSSSPKYRNVIINGMNLKEQQPLNQDLFLESITEDGVILTYQGYRFEVAVIQQWNF